MIKRITAVASSLLLVMLAASGADASALAAPVTGGSPAVTASLAVKLSTVSGPPGRMVKVSGTGFGAREGVELRLAFLGRTT